ncbi:hypothetical protein EHS25_007866 [Saitozyma podzolica]|jgi:hypothetical protein|uniref:Uncharacterized protein n=1 Tax=Saitozyma podzolica TaxID=1890683 RepID=A0A427YR15_9TREE|nr:hypothetical protein EHS25_007866 [Saitozyma podzolica]
MSDTARSTVTPAPDINAGLGVDVPETEWLSVSSTGVQRLARFVGNASAPGYTEFLQFSSSPDGLLEINTDFNTLLVTLDPPFVVPGTDLRASELQIKLPSDSLAEMDSNANPFTDRRDNVRLDFFEPGSEVSPDGTVRAWMRSTTRHNCSVVGPVVYILEDSVSPTRGSFLLQLSIPSDTAAGGESHHLRGNNHVETVVATYNPNLEAVTVRGERPGTFCRVKSEFKILPADDDPMRHQLTDFNQQPESHVLLGTSDSIANAQVFFYRPSSVEQTDWRTNLIPISTARPMLATNSHHPASPQADVEDDAAASIASTNEAEAGSSLPYASSPAQESDAEIVEPMQRVAQEETSTNDHMG